MMTNNFEVVYEDEHSVARCGTLMTCHGEVATPAFMTVGTAGAVKGVTAEQLSEVGSEIILANTYHLMLRPGVEIVESLGGLHKLMSWDGPILTDSGGYQVFSLGSLVKVTDDGVDFASHIDGARFHLDAEKAIEIQNRLGGDLIMCLDECIGLPCKEFDLERAVERTIRWSRRCKKAHSNKEQQLFGIVQGGVDLNIRKICALELVEIGFDGYAIGGLSVGEGHDDMIRTVAGTVEFLPNDKPRYLMGVGMPSDIIAAVRCGVDMFDCVLPTRNGRNAFAFTFEGEGGVRLRNSVHMSENSPIESDCDCYCCRNYSRGTLRHYFNVGEMLGPILVSLHNLRFYQRLMSKIRGKIKAGEFDQWADKQLRGDSGH